MQDEVGLGCGPQAPADPLGLDRILRLPESGRVDEDQGKASDGGALFDGVSGGPGDCRDDGPVAAEQQVEQGGFPRIGTPNDGDPDPLT